MSPSIKIRIDKHFRLSERSLVVSSRIADSLSIDGQIKKGERSNITKPQDCRLEAFAFYGSCN